MSHAVEFLGLSKSFGDFQANSEIHLQVKKGTIHAIIGENGAGKSTAMKMLYGTYKPTSGNILINGLPWGGLNRPWASPSEAMAHGIGMVHQHFMLASPHTALDNILLGSAPIKQWSRFLPPALQVIDRKTAKIELDQIVTENHFNLDLNAPIHSLTVGMHQKIEILKLLYRKAKILILDEPTGVLTPQEISELFTHLKKLAKQGNTILIITHKLKEVIQIADEVTVFRAGQVVGKCSVAETSEEQLATLMVGRKINLTAEAPPTPTPGPVVLKAQKLSLKKPSSNSLLLKEIHLEIREGEIVGLCGIEGNGQHELLQIIHHPEEYANKVTGSLEILGKNTFTYSRSQHSREGLSIIPEDRHKEGLLLTRPMRESYLLGLHRKAPFNKNGILSQNALESVVQKAITEFDIRPPSSQAKASSLSGGNQQKLIIAREFHSPPKFLIAAHPTRGVDVGAIEFIHQKILKARAAGTGTLLISSELDEILALSDRILVMYAGEIVAEFARGQATEKLLGLCMGGAHLS